MLKKLLVWVGVLVVAASLAVPAFAQTTSDLNVKWGSDPWLINQFGINGDISPFCQTIAQDPTELADWLAQFPNLANVCGFSPASGDSSGSGGGGDISGSGDVSDGGGSGVSGPNFGEQTSESGDIATENAIS